MHSGARILWDSLINEGVELVFGYPGAAVLPLFDALPSAPLRFVLCRHEQGAAHMADGYARASGRTGVAIATSGPGATNLVTGIATAMRDSVPCVFITGQVPGPMLGSDAFQEVDIVRVTQPITKLSTQVRRIEDLATAIRSAFAAARTGRPGPVLVDVCRDVFTASTLPEASQQGSLIAQPSPPPEEESLERARQMLALAHRPVLLAGHGLVASGGACALRRLAETLDAPVAMTLLGLGAIPARHPLALGMMGMHGHAAANLAIQDADLLASFGMRFDDRVVGRKDAYAPQARKIHIDIDAREIGRNVPVDLGIVGDVRDVIEKLADRVTPARHRSWRESIRVWQAEAAERDVLAHDHGDCLPPQRVVHALGRHAGPNTLVVADVGQHQMWVAQYFPFEHPGQLITSGGLGTMGFGLPAAIGAKLARPEHEVWLIAGDGGFQMTQAELATAVQERLDIRIAVVNNGFLGMVRQWQELFHERRYVATPMSAPDLTALAASHGIHAERVTSAAGVDSAIARARVATGPALVEFRVEPEALVYPMVPAGTALDAMLRRPLPEATVSIDHAQVAHAGMH